jgi:hypothetical protein
MVVKLKDVRRKALKMLVDSGQSSETFLQPPWSYLCSLQLETLNSLFSYKLPTKFKHFA